MRIRKSIFFARSFGKTRLCIEEKIHLNGLDRYGRHTTVYNNTAMHIKCALHARTHTEDVALLRTWEIISKRGHRSLEIEMRVCDAIDF